MNNCSETGCNEKATHKYRAQAGFKVPLCDKHYKEWEKYERKRSPITLMTEAGKWLIRLTSILVIVSGVLIIATAAYTVIQGTELSFDLNIGLIFFEFHLHQENPLNVSLIGTAISLAGFALFYVGFMKMEHDLW